MRRPAARLIFITGTDTGVGKTVLTALLLAHLRRSGIRALAIKPFCSGSRADPKLLHALQGGDLTLDEINPFYFPEPLAPLVAARKHHRTIRLEHVLRHIHSVRQKLARPRFALHPAPSPTLHAADSRRFTLRVPLPPTLLVEGVGGVLVPLAPRLSVLDLISELHAEVVVVASNKLGTINHTLLTLHALRSAGVRTISVVLMNTGSRDFSAASNPAVLAEFLAPVPLFHLPFLRPSPKTPKTIRAQAARLEPTLSALLP